MLEAGIARTCGLPALLLAIILVLCQVRQDYSDLRGSYCASQYRAMRCCNGRQDDCSVPILGTLCYCDDFCSNRTREEDCCPDFWTHCRNEVPPGAYILTECNYKGKMYYPNSKFKDNCNTCKCHSMDGQSEVRCDQNMCLIEDRVISYVNEVKPGWIARNYSEFWGRTLNEGIKLRLGTLNPSHSVYRMYPVRRTYNPNDLPREFDSRSKWDIRPVHDQGWCGASWALSTVDVASDRFSIMSKGQENVQLSAQHLMSCNNRGQMGCNGGHLDRAWLYMRKFGLTDEECYPWIGRSNKCKIPRKGKLSDAGCRRRNSYSLRNEFYKVGPAYRLGNETDIMQEIITSGPVQATMKVYQDFFSYESGIYSRAYSDGEESGYHSVRIVGWGEEPSSYDGRPIKFWRVANSWGREWGEDGFFRIVRGTNECDIESFVLGIWAKTV